MLAIATFDCISYDGTKHGSLIPDYSLFRPDSVMAQYTMDGLYTQQPIAD